MGIRCYNHYHLVKINLKVLFCLEDIINTPDDNDIGYFLEVDLGYHQNMRKKPKKIPSLLKKKDISEDDFNEHKKEITLKVYTNHIKNFVIGQIRSISFFIGC